MYYDDFFDEYWSLLYYNEYESVDVFSQMNASFVESDTLDYEYDLDQDEVSYFIDPGDDIFSL